MPPSVTTSSRAGIGCGPSGAPPATGSTPAECPPPAAALIQPRMAESSAAHPRQVGLVEPDAGQGSDPGRTVASSSMVCAELPVNEAADHNGGDAALSLNRREPPCPPRPRPAPDRPRSRPQDGGGGAVGRRAAHRLPRLPAAAARAAGGSGGGGRAQLARREGAGIVVGFLPLSLDGSFGPAAQAAKDLGGGGLGRHGAAGGAVGRTPVLGGGVNRHADRRGRPVAPEAGAGGGSQPPPPGCCRGALDPAAPPTPRPSDRRGAMAAPRPPRVAGRRRAR